MNGQIEMDRNVYTKKIFNNCQLTFVADKYDYHYRRHPYYYYYYYYYHALKK